MSDVLKKLAPQLRAQLPFSQSVGDELLEVSVPASSAATVYEKIRNTFDYQEDHLLRRNAILRILKRYAGAERDLSTHAPDLLRELVWAKYLPNKSIPLAFSEVIAKTIQKYEVLLAAAARQPAQEREELYRWIFDVLATDIDHVLSPTQHEEALAAFMYDALKKRMDWDPALIMNDEEKDLRLYTAVHRILLKSDVGVMRFRLLTLYFPAWTKDDAQCVEQVAQQLPRVIRAIEQDIVHPLADRLMRLIRRKAGVFRVLFDVLRDAKPDAALFTHPHELDRAVARALEARTNDFRVRIRRSVIRSVLFLFFTKTIIALCIEAPFDYFFYDGHIPLTPLLVNIFFPPFLLSIIGLSVRFPGPDNVEHYKAAIRALSVGADYPYLHTRVKYQPRTSWSTVFAVLYALLFVVIYGIFATFLHTVGFNGLAIGLFLFFLSLVTFFGIRIRYSTRDIVLSDQRTGILGSFLDIALLPIAQAGSWLSTKVSKINVFIYFFDFIIEAPLKVAIEFVEGWLTFVREKKEEI